ncbi:MBL fold metallo-hydrolase [Mycobacterium sp. ENV421]|uniref:MBL fold metallo-hydrolase n=1 Tax=Mycobacterium sp. ENV421 TaxID=1213407 RepID=UPI000C9A7EB7|nr:MBL fold metallo-hydrolase [Mycobacterium sp. ENV421]PND58733.1 MBL fold metallo-hydrolase [Mycobacterium sp. ENV421]
MLDEVAGASAATTTAQGRHHEIAWITLGTMSGPLPSAVRHQPANVLYDGVEAIVVDCGDGAVDQLSKAGISLPAVHTVILSHLHIDHTAGLYGLLGRRLQAQIPGPLIIYGPPGTLRIANAIRSSFDFASGLMSQVPGFIRQSDADITVIEITDGSSFTVGRIDVTATINTHYGYPEGSPEASRYQSLSLRFDTPTRSLVYTGDTGPSDKVERLALGADVLVSEITDPDQVVGQISRSLPFPSEVLAAIKRRFEREHLTAEEVGLLASRADVKSVVITHNPLTPENVARARTAIGSHFTGAVAFADDLDIY